MDTMKENNNVHLSNMKHKIVFVMGSTATGKSKLAVDLATSFPSEIINSDKIQFYHGLDVVTNKIPDDERRGIPHHLLGVIPDPDADLTAGEFCRLIENAITEIIGRGRLPIIVGGSTNYIQALVENPITDFQSRYDCCFLWLDVSVPVLNQYIRKRVDQMVAGGLIEEVRQLFVPGADYGRGIRRAIGVPEMDSYFLAERDGAPNNDELLKIAIEEIKSNTCDLAFCQLQKVRRLRDELRWGLHRIDATAVFEKGVKEAWFDAVLEPSLAIVGDFLSAEKIVKPKNQFAVASYGQIGGKTELGNAIGDGLAVLGVVSDRIGA